MERYFLAVDWRTGEALALFRFVDDPPIFAEERWTNDGWVETDRIVKYLIFGEGDFEEISPDEAEAFIAGDAAAPNA